MARALYFQSRVPIHFWPECVLTATYLINRTPSPLLNNGSPYERLFDEAVAYSFLKVFGCLVFASTLKANRTKFQPRARTCVFLGYPPGVKGYRLFDIVNKEIFISRDVIFHETIFPFHSVVSQEILVDPFVDLVLPHPQAPMLDVRRSSRKTSKPGYLQDFHCSLASASFTSPHTLSSVLSYDHLSSSYRAFALSVSVDFKP